ncbi:hypothetical protein WR25_13151 [Diploscapter pachys]|uniref:C2H2-type domain-containing protein n=1 Tax=Diploscapter pachys TaxID=2018661 RepID=A0A2A2LPY2_9BILA|nr:hypothetical protein WR25_13151 [Diploscapter pachys]
MRNKEVISLTPSQQSKLSASRGNYDVVKFSTVTPLFKPLMKPLDLEEEMKDIEIARGDLNDSEGTFPEDEGIMDELGMDEDELEEYDENHESPSPEKDDSTKEKSVETGLEDDDFEPPKRKRGRRRKDEVANDTDSDRIYVCSRSECQKRFANKFLLKKHEFIHTGMKPHICHYCGKGFNRKDNLIRHVRTHEQNPRFCENLMRQNRSLVETINGLFPSLTKSQKNGQKEEDDPNEGLDLHEVNPSESKSSMKIIVDH